MAPGPVQQLLCYPLNSRLVVGLTVLPGDFKSSVVGIGPRVGYLFPISNKLDGAFSGKAYWELAEKNRPAGWNLWLGLSISAVAPNRSRSRVRREFKSRP